MYAEDCGLKQQPVFKDVSSNRELWQEFRRGKIGSSMAHDAVLRPVRAFLKMLDDKPVEETDAMYFGTLLESLLGPEFVRRYKRENPMSEVDLIYTDDVYAHAEHDWMVFTPDFFVKIDGKLYDLSIKTTSAYNKQRVEEAPNDYAHCQSAHAMQVMPELCGSFVFTLIGGQSTKWHFIERDEELGRIIIDKERALLLCVESKTPPSLEGATSDDLSDLYPNSNGERKMLPPDAVELVELREELRSKIQLLEADKTLLECQLKALLGESERGDCGDYKINWKSYTNENLDKKRLREEMPEVYDKYITKSSYRRFTIGKQKNG